MTDANNGVTINIRSIIIVSLLSIAYLAFSTFLIGYKPDELTLVVIFNILFYASAITRKFILGFTIFIVYWIIFDYMKAFPNYTFREVHIEALYHAEKSLFGISTTAGILTPNEFFQ